MAYAARHPDRVSKLVLCSSYARGRGTRAINDEERRAAALDLELARVGWGRDDPAFRQVFAAQFPALLTFTNSKDYDDYVKRMRAFPKQMDDTVAAMRNASSSDCS